MLHLPEETKVDKDKKEKIEKLNTDSTVNKEKNIEQPIEKEEEKKYNGLHAFDVIFKRTDNKKYKILVIARTSESAKNRVLNSKTVLEILSVTKYKENKSKDIVEKVKVAGICKNSIVMIE